MFQNRLRTPLLALSLSYALLNGCADQPDDSEAESLEFEELAASASADRGGFVARAVPGAQRGQAEYRVPASVTIAQAILESGWGSSNLSAKDNNYFGIKCTGPSSPGPIATGCRNYPTQECNPSGSCWTENAYFRVYASMDDSMRDHGQVLANNSRYRAAFQYPNDPDQFIREVWKGGYATDPNYPTKIISLMRDNNLYQYNSGGAAPVGSDGCTDVERANNAAYGCACVDHKGNGGFCEGDGCTAVEEQNCAKFGTACVDHQCNGGFADGHGCTALEEKNCASVGTACVDHKCSGGFTEGTGCTALEEKNCASVGTACVDHKCSGGFTEGTGCTALEEKNCASVGTACVDHKCSGGFTEGTGCTALEEKNCASVGTACVDHKCSGGFTEGTGCTALEEKNCASFGTLCVDHQCSGGYGAGTGCTAKETRDCEASQKACRDHACVAGSRPSAT